MTQLTDKVREAIIGNVGTVIGGRIGITDAEILVKKFAPTFDVEDLTKLPNYQSIVSVMINNVPSSPFSMSFVPPMGQSNQELSDALKRLSATKYGRPRAQVEADIFKRLGSSDVKKTSPVGAQNNLGNRSAASSSGSSFLDEWLAKRQQVGARPPQPPRPNPVPSSPASSSSTTHKSPETAQPVERAAQPQQGSIPGASGQEVGDPSLIHPVNITTSDAPQPGLQLRGDNANHDAEVSIKLHD